MKRFFQIGFLTVAAIMLLQPIMLLASPPNKLPDLPRYYGWLPGDINGDGIRAGGDVTYGVRYFKGLGATPADSIYLDTTCDFSNDGYWFYFKSDVNGDCKFSGADITRLVAFFKGASTIVACRHTRPRGTKNVFDADINSGDTVTWYADTTYILNNMVFVESTAVLTIEAGTIVKGLPGQAADAKALIICKGAKIYAEGTQCDPIIMTASIDNVGDLIDMPEDATGAGHWGSIILLGRASNNMPNGLGQIEGIPVTEPRGAYGGGSTPDDNDNSGVIAYMSIRHGGSIIGANNEINGLTMASIGRGTTIHHVEVVYNLDDGFEWFGGTVECKYLVSAFNDDDNFDYDEGYRGKGQFWFCFKHPQFGNIGGEHDGGVNPIDAPPFTIPYIANVTYLGSGIRPSPASNTNDRGAFHFRDNAGGHYRNGIFMDGQGIAMRLEDRWPTDVPDRIAAGDWTMENTFWYNFGLTDQASFNTVDQIFPDNTPALNPPQWDTPAGALRDWMFAPLTPLPTDGPPIVGTARDTHFENPQLNGISRVPGSYGMDPRPNPAGPAAVSPFNPTTWSSWFSSAPYYGAFDPNAELWTKGWTWLWKRGYTPQ